jgi:WD40 repeat protein
VLKAKVSELTARVKVLTVENESLKAEVGMYREEALNASLNQLHLRNREIPAASGDGLSSSSSAAAAAASVSTTSPFEDAYVRAGDGVHPNRCHVSIPNLHGASNLLCCSLSPDDTVLATGGADADATLARASLPSGTSYAPEGKDALASVASASAEAPCEAPVTAVAFAPKCLPRTLASAGMDGSVHVIQYATRRHLSTTSLHVASQQRVCQHGKYVRTLVWKAGGTLSNASSSSALLASASADGVVYLHKVETNAHHEFMESDDDNDDTRAQPMLVTCLTSLHLSGAIESMCFVKDTLLCYARGTPHFTVLNLAGLSLAPTKIHLNPSLHDSHVSFCVMHAGTYDDKYVVAATDTNRNFVLDVSSSGKIVRDFYGHANDGYSQPKVAWSQSGQYVMGNTTEDGSVVVWDVASASIVDRLSSRHTQPVRDLYSSTSSNTLVTTSFDKLTNLWFYDESTSDAIPSIHTARTTDSNDMVD